MPEGAQRDWPAWRPDTTLFIGDMIKMRLHFIIAVSFALAFLASCAGKPEQFVSPNAQLGAAEVQRIYLATDRILAPDLSGTTERGGAL
ncbi:MAG: hypothetical protein AAFU86_12580, partial [Pseudomonadota bacterium]